MIDKINYEDIWVKFKKVIQKVIDDMKPGNHHANALKSLLLGMYMLEDESREANNGK